jgi:acetyl-CoA/propionyl-CoA carboxylase biotin carboxyl carrier protein
LVAPSGPGVRVDSGVSWGDVIGGAFDSLLAKLIVTGATREQALQRAARALDEFVVEGKPTVLPVHRDVLDNPAYNASEGSFDVYTTWIETDYDNQLEPYGGSAETDEPAERERVVVEVGGKRVEVVLPGGLGSSAAGAPGAGKKPKRKGGGGGGAAVSGDSLTSPMQGTVVKIAVEDGQEVAEGDLVVVIEAMKMEQPINAHKAGTISNLSATVGETVTSGAVIADITDAAE